MGCLSQQATLWSYHYTNCPTSSVLQKCIYSRNDQTLNGCRQKTHWASKPRPTSCTRFWPATVCSCKADTVEVARNTWRRQTGGDIWRSTCRDGSTHDNRWLVEGKWRDASTRTGSNCYCRNRGLSFLRASHVTRTRRAHQITAAAFYILQQRAYDHHRVNKEGNQLSKNFRD